MPRNGKWPGLMIGLVGLALLGGTVAGCGAAPSKSEMAASSAPAAAPAPGAYPAEKARAASGAVARDTAAKTEAARPQTQQGASPGEGGTGAGFGDPTFERKIVLNADISLKVKDARATQAAIRDLVNFNRGYMADANLTGSDEGGWNGRIVVRIPAANYGNMMEKTTELGEVRQERQWSQDVTDQYIDLEARVRILTEHEQRLRELALKAGTFDEWLKLTQQVNDTRIQIETLTGRLRLLSNQVEFSTINISIFQPPGGKEKTGDPKPGTLGERMTQAFKASMGALGAGGEWLLVFLAGFLPVGVMIVVVLAAIFVVVKALTRFGGTRTPPPSPPTSGGN